MMQRSYAENSLIYILNERSPERCLISVTELLILLLHLKIKLLKVI